MAAAYIHTGQVQGQGLFTFEDHWDIRNKAHQNHTKHTAIEEDKIKLERFFFPGFLSNWQLLTIQFALCPLCVIAQVWNGGLKLMTNI